MHGFVRTTPLILLSVFLFVLSGCSKDATSDDVTTPSPGKKSAAAIKVITTQAQRRPFSIDIEATGTALARESIDITSKFTNTITGIFFKQGQHISRGAVLVEFDQAQSGASLSEAQANLSESRSQLNRGRELSLTQALSRAQLEQLETTLKTSEARLAAARAHFEETIIRAPFSGRTGLKRVSLGSLVSPGMVITTLDDTSVIKLEFTVPQKNLKDIVLGLIVEARAEGLGERVFTGKISALSSRIDPITRSITVQAELPNRDGLLRPGLFMSVKIKGITASTIMLPEEALVPEQGHTYVFVVRNNKSYRQEVQIGGREPGNVAILTGLEENEIVIVEGTLRLRSGSAVMAQTRQ